LILIGSVVVLALYALATMTSRNSKAGFVTASVLFVLATASFSMRPQMLGYLFLILTLVVLERFREGKHATIWWLPILTLIWVNTHGSWIVGLGTILVYWMGGLMDFRIGALEARPWTQKERHSIACAFLLCLLALPVTPYGTRIAVSPFEFAFSLPLNVSYINEWQSMPFDIPGGKLFLALVLGMILTQTVFQLKWRVEQLALFLFGALMAFLHVRFLLIFVPFFAPLLAGVAAVWMTPYDGRRDKFVLNGVLMACIVWGIIHYFPSNAQLEQRVAAQFPVRAVQYLQAHSVPGPMYNNYGFGGYLVWSRGPEQKVFIDGRGDVYERGGVLNDYLHVARLQPGALEVLRGYGVRSCLVDRDEPLATALSISPNWKRVYVDNMSALYVLVKQPVPAR
jgi:hypothetical protein